jgi:hypothetical protein
MAILSAAAILAATDAVSEPVAVPEWGGEVIVKGMSGTERDAFEASIRPKGVLDLRNARAKLLVRVLVNEQGTRLFADSQAGDLGKRSAAVIERLYDVAARLSGMSEQAVEELEGNSDAEPTETADGSGSPSPSPAVSEA